MGCGSSSGVGPSSESAAPTTARVTNADMADWVTRPFNKVSVHINAPKYTEHIGAETLGRFQLICQSLESIDMASAENEHEQYAYQDFLQVEVGRLAAMFEKDRENMELTQASTTGVQGAGLLAKSKFEDTRARLANAKKEMRDHASELEKQAAQHAKGVQLTNEMNKILEEVFEGDYGSPLEQQLEELKNFQTYEAGEYEYTLDQWTHAIHEFTAANAALVAGIEWMQSFIDTAVNTSSTREAWFVLIHNGGIPTVYKALTAAYQHFYKIWKAHLPGTSFQGFGARDMEKLRDLVGTIFEGGQGGGDIDAARTDAAEMAELASRGQEAQAYAQMMCDTTHKPFSVDANAHLTVTTRLLREERKALISEKLDMVQINGKPVHRKEKRDTSQFVRMEQQIADMKKKLALTESKVQGQNTDASAIIIKAREEMEAASSNVMSTRHAQQAKMAERLAHRRARKLAK